MTRFVFGRGPSCKILSILLFLLVTGSFLQAGANDPPRNSGVLVMAHGGSPAWNEAVEAAVAPLRQHAAVEIAYGMADRGSLQSAAQRLSEQGVKRIAVVRLFVSGESFLHQTEYFLGVRPDAPAMFLLHEHQGHNGGTIDRAMPPPRFVSSREHPIPAIESQAQFVLSRQGLYDSPRMGEVISERASALSVDPAAEAVLILAHGEGDDALNQIWLGRLAELAAGIQQRHSFKAVQAETLREDWAHKRSAAEERIRGFVQQHSVAGERVIVVPFRVFGFGPYRSVLEGLDYVSDGRGLLPHAKVTEWLMQQASDCFQRAGWADPFADRQTSAR